MRPTATGKPANKAPGSLQRKGDPMSILELLILVVLLLWITGVTVVGGNLIHLLLVVVLILVAVRLATGRSAL